jgi:hypothetical protein
MKLCLKILAIVIVAATMHSLIGCAAPSNTFTYQNVKVSLTYGNCAANCPTILNSPTSAGVILVPGPSNAGCVNIFATVTGAPANIQYSLYPTPSLIIPTTGGGLNGTPSSSASSAVNGGISTTGSTNSLPNEIIEQASPVGYINYANGTTNFYCQPLTMPLYKGAALQQAQAMGIPQGDVLLVAGVPTSPQTPVSSCVLPTSPGCATFSQLIQLYNSGTATGPPTLALFPAEPSGYTTSILTVTHGTSFQFNGFAIGAPPCLSPVTCYINGTAHPIDYADNAVIWQVGASTTTEVTGGSTTYGTISTSGLYTAPATVPPTNPIVIQMESDLLPTVTAVAYITIN